MSDGDNRVVPGVLAIAARDLLEFARDRRTVFITFLLPLVAYPIVALATALGIRGAIEELDRREQAVPLSILLFGQDAEPLAARIAAAEAEAGDEPGWPARLMVMVAGRRPAETTADCLVRVPAGSEQMLAGEGHVELEVYGPAEEPVAAEKIEHLRVVFAAVARAIRGQRLARLGLNASLVDPLGISLGGGLPPAPGVELDAILTTISGSLLVILALLTVTGAFHPAADAFAGEKERGTIETLLLAPCSLGEIVRGKYLAVLGVTLATLAANLLALGGTVAVGLRALPPPLAGVVSGMPTVATAGLVVVTQVAMAAVASAACLAITSVVRSLKEAQHALTTVMLAVSVLSAVALLPGVSTDGPGGLLLAAVPITGQVLVARDAIGGASVAGPLLVTLLSAAASSWLALRGATAALADEELLFRGPDAAAGIWRRPAARLLPTPLEAVFPAVLGLAGIWYAQGLLPANLAWSLPLQQLLSMVLPLVIVASWQRVDLARTFRLRWPRSRGWLTLGGAALLGAGLFLLGAVAIGQIVGESPSPAAEELAGRLVGLLESLPVWLALLLVAVLPACCEEPLFRGWMLSGLAGGRPGRGRLAAAVVLQAAAFAVVHLLPERMPTTFLVGLVLGWLAVRSGSILPGIVCHAVHNAMPLVVVQLSGTPAGGLEANPLWLALTGAAAAAAGAAMVIRERPGSAEPTHESAAFESGLIRQRP